VINKAEMLQTELGRNDCGQDHADAAKIDLASKLEVSVTPYMRSGYFIEFTPPLTQDYIDYLLDRLKSGWNSLQKAYFRNAPETAEIEPSNITTNEVTILRSHGKSTILDLPLTWLRKTGELVYESRVCIALCGTGRLDSKVWSRLGIASNRATIGIRFDELGETLRLFRSINTGLIELYFERLKSILKQYEESKPPEVATSVRKASELEVFVIGTRDEQIAGFFKSLIDSRALISDVVSEQSEMVTSRISPYFAATGYGASLSDVLGNKNLIWFSLPIAIATKSGYSELREVLYAVSEKDNRIDIFGLGYDDSIKGDLAHIAANQICLYLAKE
jgi:hypothetical protein